MNLRSPEHEAAYEAFKRDYDGACVFCDVAVREPTQVLDETTTMMVVKNNFPYAEWDNFVVGDHRMIVPKRHVGSLAQLSDVERTEYLALLEQYEANHYSFYSRAPSSTSRTVTHLHTHVIQPVGY